MKTRLITGVFFTIAVLAFFMVGLAFPSLFLLYAFLLAALFLNELYPLLPEQTEIIESPQLLKLLFFGFPLALLSLPLVLPFFESSTHFFTERRDTFVWGLVLLSLFLFVLFRFLFVEHRFFLHGETEEQALQNSLRRVTQELLLMSYILLPMLSFVLSYRSSAKTMMYFFFAFFASWASDTFAYFFGIFLGRYKILPRLSPKKTWAGFVGGLLGPTVIVAVGLFYFQQGNFQWQHFCLSLLLGLFAQGGDWLASLIKRYYKRKDFGSIFPGHGGFLDRFDGVLLNFLLIYFLSQILSF